MKTSALRQRFLDYFARQRPPHRVLQPGDRTRRRSHGDVDQRRHGAVQGCVPGQGAAGLHAAPPPPRSACGPAASTTIWRTWASRPATTPSSRCWATSASATTSRPTPSASPGSSSPAPWSRATWAWIPTRLWVTVFEGADGIPADDEAAELWRKAGVPADRILRFGKKDNFWQMGDTGPCGPCSEMHYYRPKDLAGNRAELVNGDGDDIMEIWNLVFMQYEQDGKGGLTPLPKPSIDTGMGLERVASILQGVDSNYEIDLFEPIFEAIWKVAKVPARRAQRAHQPHGLPGRRRPHPRRHLHVLRRRGALQRGPRLRAAQDHPPRPALRQEAGHRGPLLRRPGPSGPPGHGRRLPGAAA